MFPFYLDLSDLAAAHWAAVAVAAAALLQVILSAGRA